MKQIKNMEDNQYVFTVILEKRMYCTGEIQVNGCNTPEEAQNKVENLINRGELRPDNIDWSDPTYEYCSFTTTGDIY